MRYVVYRDIKTGKYHVYDNIWREDICTTDTEETSYLVRDLLEKNYTSQGKGI